MAEATNKQQAVYKNIIEDFVVKEAQKQVAQLPPDISEKLRLAEVAAFALNRLQPLYTTTFYGWMHQRWHAISACSEEITDAVSLAIKNLEHGGDPLHDLNSVGEHALESKAYILVKLGRLLGRNNMQWREIPVALEAAIIMKQDRDLTRGRELSLLNRGLVAEVKSFLQRSSNKAKESGHTQPQTIEEMQVESYLLKANLGICNVMEEIVEATALNFMQKLSVEEQEEVKFAEVVAFALNHLSPMYATSKRGYQFFYQKAVNEFLEEITLSTHDAILQVKNLPHTESAPLPIDRFDRKIDKEILSKLKLILKRPNLTWRYVVQAVEEAITPA
jgi:hypothetical protein